MKLTKSQLDYKNYMETYNCIFAVLTYKGNQSSREYGKVRLVEKGNLARLMDKRVVPISLLERWTNDKLLVKKEPYIKENGREAGATVIEYHLNN